MRPGPFAEVGSFTASDAKSWVSAIKKPAKRHSGVKGHPMTSLQGIRPGFPESGLILGDPAESVVNGEFCSCVVLLARFFNLAL